MALITTLNYKLRTSVDDPASNEPKSLELKVATSNPKYLIHRATVTQDALRRQGTASCKTRSEVRGGGKKPWKQKGTGRARSGSSNSPLWRGGGVTFGPKPRLYNKKINDKEKQLALSTALYNSSNKLIIIKDSLDTLTKPSTKEVLNILEKLTPINKGNKTLLIVNTNNKNLLLSVRNIANLQLLYPTTLNLRELLLAKSVIITESALLNIRNIIQH
jgi:large subunit ribosomal protein L4